MIVVVARLKPPARIQDIIQLPVRANVTYETMPSFGTPRITDDRREFANTETRREAHLVVKILLNRCIGTAELPDFVPILKRQTAGQVLTRNSGRHGFCDESVD